MSSAYQNVNFRWLSSMGNTARKDANFLSTKKSKINFIPQSNLDSALCPSILFSYFQQYCVCTNVWKPFGEYSVMHSTLI